MTVPAWLVAHCDALRAERDVDGKVPLDVFWHLVDDMAAVPSCHTYHALRLGHLCPHHKEST